MEDGRTLHLARGAARHWLGSGQPLGVGGFATHFGRLSYEMRYDRKSRRVSGFVDLSGTGDNRVLLHTRLPDGRKILSLPDPKGARLNEDRTAIEFRNLSGRVRFAAMIG
jgi:hypothetical protein